MTGLVLEGGTFRTIYSAGIMDAFLQEEIILPYCVGVSAGISYGASYVSRQFGRNLEIISRYRRDKRYVGARNFIRSKSLFGLDFAYTDVPNRLVPLDWKTFYQYSDQMKVGVTNAITGEGEFLNGNEMDKDCTMLRATCAIPMLFPPIYMDGTPYYDGGLRNPIPFKKAFEDGCEKLIILLTRPDDYIKKLSRSVQYAARHVKKRFPALEEVLLNRHEDYNKAVEECRSLEKSGQVLIFRPEHALNSMEKDMAQIKANYKMGFEQVIKRIDEVRAFI